MSHYLSGREFRLARLCMHSEEPVLLWSEPPVWRNLRLPKAVLIMSLATDTRADCAGEVTFGHLRCKSCHETLQSEAHGAGGSCQKMKSKRNLYATRYILHIKGGRRGDQKTTQLRSLEIDKSNASGPTTQQCKSIVLYTVLHAMLRNP